ncbi:MAG TPA: T9SS type A sorting domain-containing protein [Edaphocola sp.]|nr:T9SS type A sorting domain-containing protein [Edaphocola sp.]
MKKLLFMSLLAGTTLFTNKVLLAQVGEGGFPQSRILGNKIQSVAPIITLERPDYDALIREDLSVGENGGKMYRVGMTLPAAIDFQKTGQWTYLENGNKIWRLTVEVPDAMAVALYYEKYHLPKGVALYLSNENGKQILGAYTNKQNPKNDYYSNEPVVGSKVNIEMNIDANVDISEIQYLIKYAGAIYRGYEQDLARYDQTMANPPVNPSGVLGASAKCHVNAICPLGDDLSNLKKSVARILISPNASYQGIGFCSGTLINNTSNTQQNCKPLFATASHCDDGNGHDNAHFAYWQFRFNYLSSNCDGTGLPTQANSPILTEGAKFVSRSNYPSMSGSTEHPSLVMDFLMLELNEDFSKIPDAVLAGWNRKASYTQADFDGDYSFFLGFHHPGGDMMKLAIGTGITGATFNQSIVGGTHWKMIALSGGSAGGASGSSLFDPYGRSIGVLSGGPGGNCVQDGKAFGKDMSYSKFSYGWENQYDQTSFPAYAGAQSRLKEALDPAGTGAMFLDSTSVTTCNGMAGVSIRKNQLAENAFTVFPNPSKNGLVNLQFNLKEVKDVTVNVFNTLGQLVISKTINNIGSSSVNLDCQNQSNGLYMVQVIADGSQLSKSFIISK